MGFRVFLGRGAMGGHLPRPMRDNAFITFLLRGIGAALQNLSCRREAAE